MENSLEGLKQFITETLDGGFDIALCVTLTQVYTSEVLNGNPQYNLPEDFAESSRQKGDPDSLIVSASYDYIKALQSFSPEVFKEAKPYLDELFHEMVRRIPREEAESFLKVAKEVFPEEE